MDVDGNGPIPEVARRVRDALEARGLAAAKGRARPT